LREEEVAKAYGIADIALRLREWPTEVLTELQGR
jgi:hypothetical protein